MIRILLADDHRIMREGLRELLNKQADFEVVAEAGDGRKAVSLSQEFRPDVVIMDVSMPALNGIDAARRIISDNPAVKVIALSMFADKTFVSEMFKAGSVGYILKDCACDELVFAIRAVLKGQLYLSPGITTFVLKDFLQKSFKSKASSSVFSNLSNREREVLQLFAEGKTTKEIASLLNVSPKTVETQRQNIFNKLNIHNIAELTKYAIREGLTSL
ncbi:MAG TPA: response regulator transcription factor [Dissulfurispiraceae bacterium]|nr:response regulator transcription factor [Dissulfurispiraceae bacterium]